MDEKKTSNFDFQLRPKSFDEYIGQKSAIKTLKIFVEATRKRGVPREHILFFGPAGIGKTTLAYVIANELSGNIKITSGAAIQKTGDLAAILTNLKNNDVFFIDEIHRLPKPVEELLYPVLEEFRLDIVIGTGPSARTIRLEVPRITIIGATTKLALLSAPLRDRFGLILRLDYYTMEEMIEIITRNANLLNIHITKPLAYEIAKRSRGTPRVANRILKRIQDYLQVKNIRRLTKDLLEEIFDLLNLDELGLSEIDLKYLKTLKDKFQNKPVGIETLASALSEDKRTLEEFIEPYLLQLGFIKKTPRGRILTERALKHIHSITQRQLF